MKNRTLFQSEFDSLSIGLRRMSRFWNWTILPDPCVKLVVDESTDTSPDTQPSPPEHAEEPALEHVKEPALEHVEEPALEHVEEPALEHVEEPK